MDTQDIAATIVGLKEADLTLRNKLVLKGQLGGGYHPEMAELHNKNARELEAIIDSIGYPTIDKVGQEASDAAWLVVQHAIGLPDFMKKCLKLLQLAVNEKRADPKHLAYVTDRIAVFEGKPQLYGTQFDWDENGRLSPNFFDDLTQLNQRRKSIGLNTIEEQTKLLRSQALIENQLPPTDFHQRKREFEQWKKSVGWT